MFILRNCIFLQQFTAQNILIYKSYFVFMKRALPVGNYLYQYLISKKRYFFRAQLVSQNTVHLELMVH